MTMNSDPKLAQRVKLNAKSFRPDPDFNYAHPHLLEDIKAALNTMSDDQITEMKSIIDAIPYSEK